MFTNVFLSLHNFLVQKSTFSRKNGFEYSFYRIEVQVVILWFSRLKKKQQTLEIILKVDVYAFFKI